MAQDDELESARLSMLKFYHTYNQTHAGYAIAIVVGASAIIANIKNFIDLNFVLAFVILLLMIGGVAIYQFKRVFYWTACVNVALEMNKEQLEEWFQGWYVNVCKKLKDRSAFRIVAGQAPLHL